MSKLRNKMLSLLDMTTIQVNDAVNDLFEAINTIDWERHLSEMNERKNALMAKAESLLGEVKDLLAESKDCLCDFEATVKYDPSRGETIEYDVNEGVLTVVVSLENDEESYSYKKKMTIPSGCDASQIKMEVDENAKVAKFTVPRATEETEDVEQVTAAENEEETNTIKDILSKKLKDNVKKTQERFARDSSGRFTRMSPIPQE